MSAGAFTTTKYAASYNGGGEIHPIRVQPETLSATIDGTANAAPTGAQTNPIQARSTGGKRSLGLVARYIVLKAPATGQPANYQAGGLTRIPALTEAFYNKATKGASCTYLSVTYTVVSRHKERVDGTDGG